MNRRFTTGSAIGTGIGMLILASLLIYSLTGCATFNKTVTKSKMASAALADTAMKAWADYYVTARANPVAYGTDVPKLDAQRAAVDMLSVKVGTCLVAVNSVQASFASGSSTQGQVQAAVMALSDNAAALVATIKMFLPAERKALADGGGKTK